MVLLSQKKVYALLVVGILIISCGIFLIPQKKEPSLPVEVLQEEQLLPLRTVIGRSVEGREIESYSYGTGATHLVFVGGMHGGYEWNSILLAYEAMDYLTSTIDLIPKNLTIDIIPSLNPDGVYRVTGRVGRFTKTDVSLDKKVLASGRFNAHSVDLNRNFDCLWKPKSTWQSKSVSAGTSAFSEPEAAAFRDFISSKQPAAVVFWHSQSNAVYASKCRSLVLSETITIMDIYASASKYPPIQTFNAYEITGAADDWLASINIPAITVELKTHESIEWENNLPGIKALIAHYRK